MNGEAYQLPGDEPLIVKAEVIEDGQAVGIVVRERDGTLSAVRVSLEQLAD